MEIRNVQRTGKMHYVYLPTQWCRKFNISSDTKITVAEHGDGSLSIIPEIKKKKANRIDLTLPSRYKDILVNLIMACYVNPTSSFRISMEKKVDMATLLDQKNLISSLEFVEFDGEQVTYESSMSINEPDSLLKTMVKKIKNLLFVMTESHNPALIQKYEEEIDRSKMLIQKAVISALVINESVKLKPIDMHYTAQIATELERVVDNVIQLEKSDPFLKEIAALIDVLKDILEKGSLDYLNAAGFTKKVHSMKETEDFHKGRIKRLFQSMSEILLDWAISRKIEN